MNDCSNADIRDQLPDLLHDRLTVSARAAVLAHVDGCTDCRDELELLRGVLGALVAHTPRVDIAYIVGALPKAPERTTVPVTRTATKRRWADWRVAAAVTMLVAGGGSVAILNRAAATPNNEVAARPVEIADTPTAILPAVRSTTPAASAKSAAVVRETIASADQDATTDAGPDGRFGGLTQVQLEALLDDIERLEAVPITEPEPVTIKVNVGTPAPLSETP